MKDIASATLKAADPKSQRNASSRFWYGKNDIKFTFKVILGAVGNE